MSAWTFFTALVWVAAAVMLLGLLDALAQDYVDWRRRR